MGQTAKTVEMEAEEAILGTAAQAALAQTGQTAQTQLCWAEQARAETAAAAADPAATPTLTGGKPTPVAAQAVQAERAGPEATVAPAESSFTIKE